MRLHAGRKQPEQPDEVWMSFQAANMHGGAILPQQHEARG